MSRDNESSAVKIRCSYCGRECQHSIIHSGDQLRPYCSFECAQMAYRAQHTTAGRRGREE